MVKLGAMNTVLRESPARVLIWQLANFGESCQIKFRPLVRMCSAYYYFYYKHTCVSITPNFNSQTVNVILLLRQI